MEAIASPLSSEGVVANGVASPSFNIVDPKVIVDHLASVVSIALGATRAELERPGSLLSSAYYSDTVHRCSRFATDSQVALYIQKNVEPPDDIADGPADSGE
jgi:dynein heavy chain 1, cytosolic